MIPPADYCREIEAYLCRKNDGHLVRIVGPSFDVVSRWAADGVPIKVAFRGIDRYFERYYRKGPRRRPVRIDFCDADVVDVFEEWRRAVGVTNREPDVPLAQADGDGAPSKRRGPSLPAHLQRVTMLLTNARATNRLGSSADALIDRLATELDLAKASVHGVRGEERAALISRLDAIDRELLATVRESLSPTELQGFEQQADQDLSGFEASMPRDAYVRARQAAVDRLIREHFSLPTVAFD